MNRMGLAFIFCIALCLCWGCASSPEPQEVDLGLTYRHTRAFMAEQIGGLLEEMWHMESADPATGVFRTGWDVQLHAFNTFGRRHRLEVKLEGSDGEGYRVLASQETERNTNQENPLAASEADWEPVLNDGALATLFLTRLQNRLRSKRTWEQGSGR